ncbi:hypothetical protein [Shinella sp.]|uniref:hypothetical protein n=1 Tax=Shinella sp. TaxID=1870904 RepID=UPI003F707AEB
MDSDNQAKEYNGATPGFWGIYPKASRSIDDDTYSFALTDNGQRSSAGNHVAVFLEVYFGASLHESGYSFGFTKARIRPSKSNITGCDIRFDESYNGSLIRPNSRASLIRTGMFGFIEMEALNNTLAGNYHFTIGPFFQIRPDSVPYELSYELKVQVSGINITKTDGSPLPSENKRAIIGCLLADDLSETKSANRWVTLCVQRSEIRSMAADDSRP